MHRIFAFLVLFTALFAAPRLEAKEPCRPTCEKKCHCLKCCLPKAPRAPVLGSAPALMSPLVFAHPQSPHRQQTVNALEELKAVSALLEEFKNADKPAAAPEDEAKHEEAPLAKPSAAPSTLNCEQRLDAIDQQMKELWGGMEKLEGLVVKALEGIDRRLERIENNDQDTER